MIAMMNTWESPAPSFGLFAIGIGGTFTLHRASRRNKLVHQ
jgi:hypothetical protein